MISFGRDGRSLIARIEGEIDHHTADEFKTSIEKEYGRINAKNIIFDFTGVTFMDSSGIGMLIGRYKKAVEYGGSVYAFGVSKEVFRIFEMSGLHKIIKISDEEPADNLKKGGRVKWVK
ncbi:MAG: anti-sigma factor antagonist [Clostridiales bacterium]|jgi:stage II sporulation protein AA (anti-sigma F factor antagonist)|nr:anti-sigma factor antagonist [Clostridiales bacterium]